MWWALTLHPWLPHHWATGAVVQQVCGKHNFDTHATDLEHIIRCWVAGLVGLIGPGRAARLCAVVSALAFNQFNIQVPVETPR